jgi:hypothetical protein
MINKVAKNIILNAVKTHGRDIKKVMSYIDEKIAPEGVKEIKVFLEWSFTNRGYLRQSNFDTCFAEFQNIN